MKAPAAPTQDLVLDPDETILDLAGGISCSNGELRIKVVQRLSTSMMSIIPHAMLAAAAGKLRTPNHCGGVVLPSNAELDGAWYPPTARMGMRASRRGVCGRSWIRWACAMGED